MKWISRFIAKKQEVAEISEKEIQELLGDPEFISYSEDTIKARRNLIAYSATILAGWWLGVQNILTAEWNVLFKNSTITHPERAADVMAALLIYTGVHYWILLNHDYLKFKNRLTGSSKFNLLNDGNLNSEVQDLSHDRLLNPTDYPKKSSLLAWWSRSAGRIQSYGIGLDRLRDDFTQLKEEINLNHGNLEKYSDIKNTLERFIRNHDDIQGSLNSIKDIISTKRDYASLARYEKNFYNFTRSQRFRFKILDVGLPAALTFLALIVTTPFTRRIIDSWCYGLSLPHLSS